MKRIYILVFILIVFCTNLIILAPLATAIKPFIPYASYLFGTNKPATYLILLGNDTEIRANGGFAGSYAKVSLQSNLKRTRLTVSPIINFQDIYVPNGQLDGYVTPPEPIQKAFQKGSWELANADWEPDFPTAATSIRWFLEKGGETNPDNLLTLNLSTIKKVLDIVGSFTVSDYQAEITPENLYLFLQGKAEVNFFPGSTQKKDALTAVGNSLYKKLSSLSIRKKIQIAKLLYQDLQNQNILINSQNPDFQAMLEKNNFAGKLTPSDQDTYLLVEANLGANKANAYVERNTKHSISFKDGQTTHQATVHFTNSSPESNPNPPFHYGGNYIAYLRFYIPQNAQNIKIDREIVSQNPENSLDSNPIKTSSKYGLIEIGFFQTTPALNQSTLSLSYTIPTDSDKYSLSILKQHGLTTSPQTIILPNKTYTTNLEDDFKISY